MQVSRDESGLHMAVNAMESLILGRILKSLRKHYEAKPSELEPNTAAVWYSTRGCQSARLSDEETQEWIAQLHRYRSDSLPLLDQWIEQLNPTPPRASPALTIPWSKANHFLRILNDHRLFAAAQQNLGQTELDTPFLAIATSLSATQRVALFEVHLLAEIIESLLQLIPNSGADWRDAVIDPEHD